MLKSGLNAKIRDMKAQMEMSPGMLDTVTAWGYCAAKDERYYGLKGHVMINLDGYITACPVAPANVDERELLAESTGKARGMLIGDKGYIGAAWAEHMADTGIDLQTPLRDNMADTRPGWAVRQLLKVRKKVETVLSVLTEQFAFTRIKAHDIWHFTSKLCRKILAYNVYITLKS